MNIFDIEPQIGGFEEFGPEPSLREIVYGYYKREGFSGIECVKNSEEYFEQLISQWEK